MIIMMIKKYLLVFGFVGVFGFGFLANDAFGADILVFNGEGCPHCAHQTEWMTENLSVMYPHLEVVELEV